MVVWPKIVESFPLTVQQVFSRYTRIPDDASDIFYHYTSHAGLEGILESGGLRATYRMRMNDVGEFDYARNVVYGALNEMARRRDLSRVAYSLIRCTRKNLYKLLNNTSELSSAYCACLTVSSDDAKQWESYAEFGSGFAIGLDMSLFLNMQIPAVKRGEPFVFCAPVIYDQHAQCNLVWHLIEAGICDIQTFTTTHSRKPINSVCVKTFEFP